MRLTIELDTQEEFDWLLPALQDIFRQQPSLSLKSSHQDYQKRLDAFLTFIEQQPISVKEVSIPNREVRNERS